MKSLKRKIHVQYAALPFRLVGDVLQVLLVTSRETKRWVIPKGWPEKHLKPHQVAAAEAYEEAGLRGEVVKTPIAAFEYVKVLADRSAVLCLVEVFPLRVQEMLNRWPEQDQRKRCWMSAQDAADAVQEKGLKRLLLEFARHPDPADFSA